jgi:actin-related protein
MQGVVLTGGLSLMGGLRDRLEKELAEQGPQAAKFKVTMPANPTERRFSVWIGEHWGGCLTAHSRLSGLVDTTAKLKQL